MVHAKSHKEVMKLKILSFLIYYIVRLLNLTYRYRYIGLENLPPPRAKHILAIWHQNLFPGILAQNGHHYVVIVSKSKDAEPVAYTCNRLGHRVERGSSKKGNVDKGGKVAKDQMIETLKLGIPGAVTIDGPKGPAKEVKPGIISMAKKAEIPIVPYIVIPDRYYSFNSWDRFRFPKPFCRIIVSYGKPIDYQLSFEEMSEQLASSLNQLEEELVPQFKNWSRLSKENP